MVRLNPLQPDAPVHPVPELEGPSARDPARLLAEGVLASSLDGVEILALDGRVRGLNARSVALHGVASEADIVGHAFGDRFAAIDREDVLRALRAAAGGTPSRARYDCRMADGRARRLDITLQPADRGPSWIVATSREADGYDTTAGSTASSALQALAAVQAMPQMLWMGDTAGRLEWVNARMGEALPPRPSEEAATCLDMDCLDATWLDATWLDVVHPEDLRRVAASWAEALRFGSPFETEVRTRSADGTDRWRLASAQPRHAADGSLTGWVGALTDIGRQKAAADALARDNEQLEQDIFKQLHEVKRTQSRLQAYFDACPDYLTLMLLSKHGGLTYEDLNPAAVALEGRERSGVVGRHPSDIVGAEAAGVMEDHVKRCLRTGRSVDYTVERRRDDGGLIAIQVVGAPLEYFNEEEGLVLFCGRDITEQRGVEEALRQSQKMEAVGQLTGGLAHDFNNLLTGITGSLDLLQSRLAKGRYEALDRYITTAQSAAARAASLTHRLLAFSRRQTLDPKATCANTLVAGMVDLIQRTVGPAISLDVAAAAGLWTVLVDPSQLENALLNLCINARDAMPDGGRIVIETANVRYDARAGVERAGGKRPGGERPAGERDVPVGDYVVVSVTDDGVGMTADVVKRIFDPFFTTKPIGMGSGLGLSMIYGFARQSGGQVRVHSRLGFGTTLRILLPRHLGEAEAAEPSRTFPAAPRAMAGDSVLVVDDEATIRLLVRETLEDLGYTTLEAEDGPSGLKLLQSRARIDLLVTDVGLPGGMNGRQVAEIGRALRPALKILFITGYAENAMLNQAHLGAGMHILVKPFAMETLANRVRTLIQEPHREPHEAPPDSVD